MRVSEEQIAIIVERRESGVSLAEIARELKISRGSVEYQCLKLGADPPVPYKLPDLEPIAYERSGHTVRRFSPEEDAKLLALTGSGMRLAAVARELGRGRNSVIGRLMTLARRQERAEASA